MATEIKPIQTIWNAITNEMAEVPMTDEEYAVYQEQIAKAPTLPTE